METHFYYTAALWQHLISFDRAPLLLTWYIYTNSHYFARLNAPEIIERHTHTNTCWRRTCQVPFKAFVSAVYLWSHAAGWVCWFQQISHSQAHTRMQKDADWSFFYLAEMSSCAKWLRDEFPVYLKFKHFFLFYRCGENFSIYKSKKLLLG